MERIVFLGLSYVARVVDLQSYKLALVSLRNHTTFLSPIRLTSSLHLPGIALFRLQYDLILRCTIVPGLSYQDRGDVVVETEIGSPYRNRSRYP
jgi:hypothetical protein